MSKSKKSNQKNGLQEIHFQSLDVLVTRPRARSQIHQVATQIVDGRRQRSLSQVQRRVSQTFRRHRESRHALQGVCETRDQSWYSVKKLDTKQKHSCYFDTVRL